MNARLGTEGVECCLWWDSVDFEGGVPEPCWPARGGNVQRGVKLVATVS